jgi:hypothetical protein
MLHFMGDLLKLIWCTFIGLFWSRASREAEILTLRHQLNVQGATEAQTCPCRSRNGSQPNRKITQVTTGDHEPEAKEYHGSRRSNPRGAGRGIISMSAQGANPRSAGGPA